MRLKNVCLLTSVISLCVAFQTPTYAKRNQGDLDKQVAQYEKNSAIGDPEADYALGLIYSKKKLGVQDFQKAHQHLKSAAQKGHVDAQMRLAYVYEKGIGVSKDLGNAFQWYEQAAKQKNTRAQYKLGLAYMKGLGIEQDIPQAVAWLEEAADHGSRLSDIYQKKLKRKVSPMALSQARADVKNVLQDVSDNADNMVG